MSLLRSSLLRANLLAIPRPITRSIRFSSSTTEPTILPRLQNDLKLALRAKNKPTLNVIRALQAEIINASKTAKPITTDGALYALIQKQIKASSTAIEEFQAAKRDDLVEKEQGQLDVLRKYAGEIPTVEAGELDIIIGDIAAQLEEGKRTFGSIMGKVMGALKGRPHDVEYVTSKIQELVGKK
ncbi:GatB/YqeY domain-containing protein [Dothidotthia symphoricarpi CBS 119687]|uniref:Altered inheritance of mitochondria protein 41 n=1 Tax=Dothidotthia symphoricarpi CBS 119687 TaxID=1392245 RepID=A0A6A5ZZW5_9PLEO|nr:GatB/YqeY domain-containing protein [Dothidotthia symphoricarpi CBS 119687]KAF2125090.1 GatB/YqeY domain-containing protein [Dothidotthia symphoricarpi CBS 119687]